MQLDSGRLAIALGGTTAILWIVCSVLVAFFSGGMMTVTGHMLHMDAGTFGWHLTFPGFLVGLIAWTISAAVAGWLIAWIYNTSDRSRHSVS